MKRYISIVLLFFFILLLSIAYIFTYTLPEYFLLPDKSIIKAGRGNITVISPDYNDFLNYEKIIITTDDNIQIHAILKTIPGKNCKGTVILIHGMEGCKEDLIPLGNNILNYGWNICIMDLRAHGESGGKYCTYGYYEKQDIKQLINTLQNDYKCYNIGIYGRSLGAAIALQAMETDNRIRFGIIESSFADLENLLETQIVKHFHINIPFLTKYILQRAGKIGEFEPFKIKPAVSAKNITHPVLISHGNEDKNVDCANSKYIFSQLVSSYKKLVIYIGANHYNLNFNRIINYNDVVHEFLVRQESDIFIQAN